MKTQNHHLPITAEAPGHALLDIEISARGRSNRINFISDGSIDHDLVRAVGTTLVHLVSAGPNSQRLLVSLIKIAGIVHAELAFARGKVAENGEDVDRMIETVNKLLLANSKPLIPGQN